MAADILGHCLWDICSDNHRVTTADGKAVELGSFRLAAAFITAFHDSPHAEVEEGVAFCGHSRLYPGSLWDRRRADLSPVYELIFRRMRRHALDWAYVPPQVFLVSFNDDHSGDKALQASMSEANYESILEVGRNPPPITVLAYYAVYGQWPRGWPPSIGDVL